MIKEADKVKFSNKRSGVGAIQNSMATLGTNTSELAIGLSNASKLLMTLANGVQNSGNNVNRTPAASNKWVADSPNSSNNMDDHELNPQELESMVRSIFAKLDVDGDGLISWWEWKSVLTASLCAGSSNNSNGGLQISNSSQDMIRQLINPLDPLLVSFYAAFHALSVTSKSTSTSNSPSKSSATRFPEELNLQEIQSSIRALQQKFGVDFINYDNNFTRVVSQQGLLPAMDEDMLNDSSGAGKTSKVASRLNQMVKSLRYSNTILSKRLEDALLISQQLQLSSPENAEKESNDTTLQNQLKQYEDNLHSIKLQEQVEHLDKQSVELLQQYEQAKLRGDKLAVALLEQNNTLKIAKQQRFLKVQERRKQNDKILQEIETRSQQLLNKRNQKKRKFFALVTLKMFFMNVVKPKILEKQQRIAAQKIASVASKTRAKKKYLEKKSNQQQAAILIQKRFRGHHAREALKEQAKAILRIQCLYRRHHAQEIVEVRRYKKQQIDFLLKKNLAAVVTKIWKGWKFMRINKAAMKLSKVFRKKAMYNRFQKSKKMIEEDKATKKKEEDARGVITRNISFHAEKKKARKLRKHALHVNYFEEERLTLYAMSSKPEIDQFI